MTIDFRPLGLCAALILGVVGVTSSLPSQALAQEGTPPAADVQAQAGAQGAMDEGPWHLGPEDIKWTVGPTTGDLGENAQITVNDQYAHADGDGARSLMVATQNLVNNREVGMVAPLSGDYIVLFEFNDSGYVKDDDRDELDPDALMEDMKENELAANEERESRGMPTLTLTGWAVPPHYDPITNNLEWGIEGVSSRGGTFVNYNTKLLGRHGVMDVTLLVSPEELEAVMPAYRELLKGFSYKKGSTYAEFTSGDKVAAFGLAGLIVGGGAALAAKTGLFAVIAKFFAKAGKLIVVAVIGVFAALKKLLGMGSKSE